VIDDDVKGAASYSSFNVTKILTTENLSINNRAIIINNDKLVELNYKNEYREGEETIYITQFLKLYIDSLDIGAITDKIKMIEI
jgi:hypothetical protein